MVSREHSIILLSFDSFLILGNLERVRRVPFFLKIKHMPSIKVGSIIYSISCSHEITDLN